MSKNRYSARTDSNQAGIVKALRKIGCFVKTGLDDIIVYHQNKLTQIEVKESSPFCKNGRLRKNDIKDTQYEYLCHANYNYLIAWKKEQILDHISDSACYVESAPITPEKFRRYYKEWLSESELKRLRGYNWFNL